jgi:hypothetical protein
MNLETELRALEIAWPETPAFALQQRKRRRWVLVAALAAAAIVAAFAVPQSRGAILRFFHLGAATVEFVDTLPPADRRPLTAELGRPILLDAARVIVPGLRLPPVTPTPPVYYAGGQIIAFIFRSEGSPVLLNEIGSNDPAYLKKLSGFGTRVEGVDLYDGGLWISGREHVVTWPNRSPRLAGNVLIWREGGTTYRLEGPGLTQERAIRLAQSLRRG